MNAIRVETTVEADEGAPRTIEGLSLVNPFVGTPIP